MTARPGWHTYMLTATAPSDQAHNRWDPGFLRGSRPPCTSCADCAPVADWNPTAGRCWNRLRTALRDHFGDLQFHRFSEIQTKNGRGAIHHHIVVVTRHRLSVLDVQDMAQAAGYGCTVDLRLIPLGDEQKTARYVSKYVSKGSDRSKCRWRADRVDKTTGEVTLSTVPTYKSHSSSRDWGITMREIREELRSAARRRAATLAALEILEPTGSDVPDPAGVPAPI